MVCDVYCDPMRSISTKVEDLELLKQFCNMDKANNDIQLRVFLVEDMTAPVVEILGAAFHCHPQMFEEHMRTSGPRTATGFDSAGRFERAYRNIITNHGGPIYPSEYKTRPHFSLPFHRRFKYRSLEAEEDHNAKRTMWSKYSEGKLEERVTGALYTAPNLSRRVGESFLSHQNGRITLKLYFSWSDTRV